MTMVEEEDLLERKIGLQRGMTKQSSRMHKAGAYIEREMEEWQAMLIYRRDRRFTDLASDTPHTLESERVIWDILNCTMRMHEKVVNVLYGEIFNGKTKTRSTVSSDVLLRNFR